MVCIGFWRTVGNGLKYLEGQITLDLERWKGVGWLALHFLRGLLHVAAAGLPSALAHSGATLSQRDGTGRDWMWG